MSLKVNILEEQYPFFTDEQLEVILQDSGGDVKLASYNACMMKAQIDGVSLGQLKIESNAEFWLKLARNYQPVRSTGLQRLDENV